MLPIAESFAVVDFRQTSQPRSYLSRREQWRLLLLVASLGLVVLLMGRAGDPSNWAWLFGTSGGSVSPSRSFPAEDAPLDDPVGRKPKGETPGGGGLPARSATPEETADGYFPGVKPAYLDAVCDDSVVRDQEQDAWFHLFEILDKTDEARLRRGSIGQVTRGQLFRQSKQYRGQLVTIGGKIRQTSLPWVADNDYQIDRYYRTVLQPEDDRSQLMFVYCLHLPKGFPQGPEVSADVEVTGFYFKRWPYSTKDTIETAPVLLARTVRWIKRPPAVEQRLVGVGTVLTWAVVALCVSLLVVAYVYRRTCRIQPEEPTTPPHFDALRDVPIASGPRLPWEPTDRREPGE